MKGPEIAPELWLGSRRPWRGWLIRTMAALMVATAALLVPVVEAQYALLALGVVVFFAIPVYVLRIRLPKLASEVEALRDKSAASALQTRLREDFWVEQFAPAAWLPLQEGRIQLVLEDGRAAARHFAEVGRLARVDDTKGRVDAAQAHALLLAGDRREARDLFAKLEARDVLEPADALAYGVTLISEPGRLDDAKTHFEAANAKLGDQLRSLAGLAAIYERVGEARRAHEVLEKLESLDLDEGDDPIAADLLKRARKGVREWKKAEDKRARKKGKGKGKTKSKSKSKTDTEAKPSEEATADSVVDAAAEPTAKQVEAEAEVETDADAADDAPHKKSKKGRKGKKAKQQARREEKKRRKAEARAKKHEETQRKIAEKKAGETSTETSTETKAKAPEAPATVSEAKKATPVASPAADRATRPQASAEVKPAAKAEAKPASPSAEKDEPKTPPSLVPAPKVDPLPAVSKATPQAPKVEKKTTDDAGPAKPPLAATPKPTGPVVPKAPALGFGSPSNTGAPRPFMAPKIPGAAAGASKAPSAPKLFGNLGSPTPKVPSPAAKAPAPVAKPAPNPTRPEPKAPVPVAAPVAPVAPVAAPKLPAPPLLDDGDDLFAPPTVAAPPVVAPAAPVVPPMPGGGGAGLDDGWGDLLGGPPAPLVIPGAKAKDSKKDE